MKIYDCDGVYMGVEINKFTDPLNLYKAFIKYKEEFGTLPRYIEICLLDKYSGWQSYAIRFEQYTKTNYLYKTDRIIEKMGYRQTNYGWFCEILQHAYQDFLQYEKGELD